MGHDNHKIVACCISTLFFVCDLNVLEVVLEDERYLDRVKVFIHTYVNTFHSPSSCENIELEHYPGRYIYLVVEASGWLDCV